MSFKFSSRSASRLRGVHPELVDVMRYAIKQSPIDFGVSEGVRTIERQRELVAAGASQTMRSRHLRQDDGHSHALDIYAYVGDRARWELPLYIMLADVIREIAKDRGVSLTWGAAWGRRLTGRQTAQECHDAYVELRRKQGRKPFIDAPHFQIEL